MRAHNPWLTYSSPLHLARMFGLPDKLFDALDEEALLPSQCAALAQALLGGAPLPSVDADRHAFAAAVRAALASAPQTFDPTAGKMRPWIDVPSLERHVRVASGQDECTLM